MANVDREPIIGIPASLVPRLVWNLRLREFAVRADIDHVQALLDRPQAGEDQRSAWRHHLQQLDKTMDALNADRLALLRAQDDALKALHSRG